MNLRPTAGGRSRILQTSALVVGALAIILNIRPVSLAQGLSREYIRLGTRVIAVEASSALQLLGINGTSQPQRSRLNLIAGSNVTISNSDDPGSDSSDVTISASGVGGGGGGASPSGFQLFDGTHYWNWFPAFQDTTPSANAFSWVNQGSATETASGGQLFLHCPDLDGPLRIRVQNIGSNTTAVGAVVPVLFGGGGSGTNPTSGLVFRESSTGKLTALNYGWDNSNVLLVSVWSFSSPTAFTADITRVSVGTYPYALLKLQLSGSNLVYSFSFDGGANYVQLLSEGKTARFTTAPDQWGYFCASGGARASVALTHWAPS